MSTYSERKAKVPSRNEIGKYTTGVTVRLTGVEAHRIRRYEGCGLLKPVRTEGGQRLYSDPDIELIKEIASLEDRGANLEGIKIILAMKHGKKRP